MSDLDMATEPVTVITQQTELCRACNTVATAL